MHFYCFFLSDYHELLVDRRRDAVNIILYENKMIPFSCRGSVQLARDHKNKKHH